MGAIGNAEMRETREERRQYEEAAARRARAEEERVAAIRRTERIRDQSLLRVTNQIITEGATQADIDFILSELNAWKQVVLKTDVSHAHSFLDNQLSFPQEIRDVLNPLLPLLQLKLQLHFFTFTDRLVNRTELLSLLSLVQDVFLLPHLQTEQPSILFMTQLMVFVESIHEEAFGEKQTLCLQRILNDYQINLLGEHNLFGHLMASVFMRSITLSQLNPKPNITQGLNINVDNFSVHRGILEERIASLPLSIDTKKTIYDVILPGITAIIDDEQSIVDHVREHYGELYYLNEKLPLHTDHVSSIAPEEYRHVLRQLLINVFGAAEIAHNKGCLTQFCEKISTGYCFEGRVRDVFEWVSSFSDVKLMSFHETMEKYFQKEYLPYAETLMTCSGSVPAADLVLADPIMDFIMARHKNAACLRDAIYAPYGQVTRVGVKKYLANILMLVSQRDCDRALVRSRELRGSLQTSVSSFWTSSSRQELMQIKIEALTALETRIATDGESPDIAARTITAQYPRALYSYFFESRTKTLLNQLEAGIDPELSYS